MNGFIQVTDPGTAAERIQVLKNIGFGLATIAEILDKYEDPGQMEQFLLVKQKELEEQVQMTQQRLQLLANWIRDNGYEFNGSSFCIYHVSPQDAKISDDLVTEVCFPVKKA